MFRNVRRSALAILLSAVVVLGFTPSHADSVICVTAYYRLLGGSKQYILNNQCYVPSSWPAGGGGGHCETHNTELGQPTLQVCVDVTASDPVP